MKYPPWPIQAPPVCTAYWNDSDWLKYWERFRPLGYSGAALDEEAFSIFYEAELEKFRKGQRGWGSPFTARGSTKYVEAGK
jgi:hypothetical protein